MAWQWSALSLISEKQKRACLGFSFLTCKKLAPSSLMRSTRGLTNLRALLEWFQDHKNNVLVIIIISSWVTEQSFSLETEMLFLFPLPENPATFKAYFSLMWRKILKNKTGYAHYLALPSFHPYEGDPLTLSLPNVAESKFLPNFQISFSKILRNK